MSRRTQLVAALVLAVVAVVGFVLVWFQPQKLVIDERADDVAPESVSAEELATASFVSLDHETTGRVRILDGDGTRVVRLEDLATSNGPDLYLYLSTNDVSGPEGAFDDDIVNLGRLKGNLGDQNYDVPAGTDLARYRSVLIWCDRFDSAFGAAALDAT